MSKYPYIDGTILVSALVLWYQLKMTVGLQVDIDKFNKCYKNCIEKGQ